MEKRQDLLMKTSLIIVSCSPWADPSTFTLFPLEPPCAPWHTTGVGAGTREPGLWALRDRSGARGPF